MSKKRIKIDPLTGKVTELAENEYVDTITGQIKEKEKDDLKQKSFEGEEEPEQHKETPNTHYSGKTHINPITGEKTPLKIGEEVDLVTGRIVKKQTEQIDNYQQGSPNQESHPQNTKIPQINITPQDKQKYKIILITLLFVITLYNLLIWGEKNPFKATLLFLLILIFTVGVMRKKRK
tara:strand:+ start:829 stop:1362 length:534 start_codon:yes stop_codon:yes gene_type:complete